MGTCELFSFACTINIIKRKNVPDEGKSRTKNTSYIVKQTTILLALMKRTAVNIVYCQLLDTGGVSHCSTHMTVQGCGFGAGGQKKLCYIMSLQSVIKNVGLISTNIIVNGARGRDRILV